MAVMLFSLARKMGQKTSVAFAIACAAMLSGVNVAVAEKAEWEALFKCVDAHKASVARAVASLDEGTDLLVDVLCLELSTEVANAMLRTRDPLIHFDTFGEAFSSFLVVIERDVKKMLYLEKLNQL